MDEEYVARLISQRVCLESVRDNIIQEIYDWRADPFQDDGYIRGVIAGLVKASEILSERLGVIGATCDACGEDFDGSGVLADFGPVD